MSCKTCEDFFIAWSKLFKRLPKYTECFNFRIFEGGISYKSIFSFWDESSNCCQVQNKNSLWLKITINKQHQEYGLTDKLKVPISERTKNTFNWPRINLGHIFYYTLKTRDFQRDYIGCYKDEKAYSYFDSGFVSEILLHIQDVVIKTAYCKVSFHGLEFRIMGKYWLAGVCRCMVGVSQCCNHVIACLYKFLAHWWGNK